MSLGEGNIILDGELSKITLGTANPVILQGGNTDNFLALGGKSTFSDEGSGTNGIIIGMDSTNPQAEFVAGPADYFIFDSGVDIKTTSFELSANSGNLQVSSGDRDPDAQGVEGMSGSKLRGVAMSGDEKTFKSGLASKLSDADKTKIYNLVRKNLKEAIMNEWTEEDDLNKAISHFEISFKDNLNFDTSL